MREKLQLHKINSYNFLYISAEQQQQQQNIKEDIKKKQLTRHAR